MTHSELPCGARPISSLASRAKRKFQRTLIIAGLAVLSLAACGCSRQQPEQSAPTTEENAYLQNIQITNARMTAAENFLQQTVTVLHARTANKGNKTVRYLELDLAFSNFMGQVDLREKAYPITTDTSPLKPGETRKFQVSFDHVPSDWNQAPPKITVVRVVLAEDH